MIKSILKNSSVGIFTQITTIFLAFLTRSFFIKYLGVELLGINSTFTSILSTLSLTELGFQSAVVYAMYKPISLGDEETINEVLNIFGLIYKIIGVVFVCSSFVVTPLLQMFLKGIEVTYEIRIYFLLQMFGSACTYFLSYKRTMLYADQKEYISKSIDLVFNIVFNIIQIIVIALWRNYQFYLILKIIQVYGSNIIILIICNKMYPYLHKSKINTDMLKRIMANVKDIFWGKIASYVYLSTDNIVISTFVGTISVGYLVNYTTVATSIKQISNSLLNPITPIIGNFLAKEKDDNIRERVFRVFSHVRYIIALILVIPLILLINEFVTIWIGSQYILSNRIAFLLGLDLYIHIVHSATCDFIYGLGIFKFDKYISLIGAIINIVLSMVLANFWGIFGVLFGTIVSQNIFWIMRSWIVYNKCFDISKIKFLKYWINNFLNIFIFIVLLFICKLVTILINIHDTIFSFLLKGVVCEAIIMFAVLIIFKNSKEQVTIFKYIRAKITRN